MRRWSYQHYTPSGVSKQQAAILGSVLIWRGARIVPNPQRLDGAEMLRVGTTRAPPEYLKFKSGHCPILILSSHVNKQFTAATRPLFVNIPDRLGADYWP